MNKQQQSSTLVIALAIIAATMLVSTVIVEALDLIGDAEAKEKRRKRHKSIADQSDSMDIKRVVAEMVPTISNIYSW